MPGMNDYEFAKQVKRINPQVRIILMTAFEINQNEFSNLLARLKVDAFIKKPVFINEPKRHSPGTM
jgi:two-component SAPR family response regulator